MEWKTEEDKKFEEKILKEIRRYDDGVLEYISDRVDLRRKFRPHLTEDQLSYRFKRLDSSIKSRWRSLPKHACSRYTVDELIALIRQQVKDFKVGKRASLSTLKDLNVGPGVRFGFNQNMPKDERQEYAYLVQAQNLAKLRNKA